MWQRNRTTPIRTIGAVASGGALLGASSPPPLQRLLAAISLASRDSISAVRGSPDAYSEKPRGSSARAGRRTRSSADRPRLRPGIFRACRRGGYVPVMPTRRGRTVSLPPAWQFLEGLGFHCRDPLPRRHLQLRNSSSSLFSHLATEYAPASSRARAVDRVARTDCPARRSAVRRESRRSEVGALAEAFHMTRGHHGATGSKRGRTSSHLAVKREIFGCCCVPPRVRLAQDIESTRMGWSCFRGPGSAPPRLRLDRSRRRRFSPDLSKELYQGRHVLPRRPGHRHIVTSIRHVPVPTRSKPTSSGSWAGFTRDHLLMSRRQHVGNSHSSRSTCPLSRAGPPLVTGISCPPRTLRQRSTP